MVLFPAVKIPQFLKPHSKTTTNYFPTHRIGHDNSGSFAGWLVQNVDVQGPEESYSFYVNKWIQTGNLEVEGLPISEEVENEDKMTHTNDVNDTKGTEHPLSVPTNENLTKKRSNTMLHRIARKIWNQVSQNFFILNFAPKSINRDNNEIGVSVFYISKIGVWSIHPSRPKD